MKQKGNLFGFEMMDAAGYYVSCIGTTNYPAKQFHDEDMQVRLMKYHGVKTDKQYDKQYAKAASKQGAVIQPMLLL